MMFLPWLVIVNNFYVFGARRCPAEANPPLIIYSDAVLPSTVPAKRFETIAGRYSQITEEIGCVDYQ